jgi:hypothetical protein
VDGYPNRGEREFEVGKDEFWSSAMGQLFANAKRTYDEYQNESLESVKQNRTLFNKILTDAQQYDNTRQGIANQALQHAVENANFAAKKLLEHGEIAVDRQWNVDEVAQLVAKTPVFLDAIAAMVAKAVADAVSTE